MSNFGTRTLLLGLFGHSPVFSHDAYGDSYNERCRSGRASPCNSGMLRFLRCGGGIGLIIGFTFIPEATKGQVQNGAPSKDGIPSTDDPSFVSPDVASD